MISRSILAPLFGLAISTAGIVGAVPSVQAAGMAGGPLDPSLWILNRTAIDPTDPAGSPADYSDSLPAPDYLCADASTLSCIESINPSDPSSFDVVGSNTPDIGPANDNVTIAWTLLYQGPPMILRFDLSFGSVDDPATDVGFFSINGARVAETSKPETSSNFFEINPNDTIAFGVFTADNNGTPGILSVTNLSYSYAPGPLPILGAAAAWNCSRRLRRRLQGPPLSPPGSDAPL